MIDDLYDNDIWLWSMMYIYGYDLRCILMIDDIR